MEANKFSRRLKKATKVRANIKDSGAAYRLTVNKSNQHIYAQMFSECGAKVVAAASSLEKGFPKGNNIENSKKVGQLVAKRAIEKGVKKCAFDRSGFSYHGKIKALADAARNEGLEF